MLSSPSESRLQVVFQFRALCFHLLQNLYTKNSFAKGAKNHLKKKKKNRPEIVTNLLEAKSSNGLRVHAQTLMMTNLDPLFTENTNINDNCFFSVWA